MADRTTLKYLPTPLVLLEEGSMSKESFPTTLAGFGLEFSPDGGRLLDRDGEAFVFDERPGDKAYNQARYEALGRCVTEHIYSLMVAQCGMQRAIVPIDSVREGDPTTCLFHTRDLLSNEFKLMVLIQGSGAVRAGQWARSLIINDSLESGSQIPFIQQAQEHNYAVIVLNPNDNYGLDLSGKRVPIEGSETPEAHTEYAFDHFVKRSPARVVNIVGHSYGGHIVNALAKKSAVFRERVTQIALTDSTGSLRGCDEATQSWLSERTVNWASSAESIGTAIKEASGTQVRSVSAGVAVHERTSSAAMDSIFAHFAEEGSMSKESFPTTLAGFGLEFSPDGGRLLDRDGEAFVFDERPGDKAYNQARYEALGRCVTEHIYSLMVAQCGMQRAIVPIDSVREGDPTTCLFHTRDLLSNEFKLMVLIQGSGAVRAGQWARSLIINDSLESGSQIPFIQQAQEHNYAVIVLNPNDNYGLDLSGKRVPIEGSETPEAHTEYAFDHFVKRSPARVVNIVGHSYGGHIVNALAQKSAVFRERVTQIALTDSTGSLRGCDEATQSWLSEHTVNWASSEESIGTAIQEASGTQVRSVSAGVAVHERTTSAAMDSIFAHFADTGNHTSE
ncbi:cotranscriptional regulator ARB2A-like [Sycon ciliatum]|uniref:cotranscriptional regulator ARB2A-like n=1 Tax=Sycon ciliatum TaxID=27933 RepID=UPI0031F71CF7